MSRTGRQTLRDPGGARRARAAALTGVSATSRNAGVARIVRNGRPPTRMRLARTALANDSRSFTEANSMVAVRPALLSWTSTHATDRPSCRAAAVNCASTCAARAAQCRPTAACDTLHGSASPSTPAESMQLTLPIVSAWCVARSAPLAACAASSARGLAPSCFLLPAAPHHPPGAASVATSAAAGPAAAAVGAAVAHMPAELPAVSGTRTAPSARHPRPTRPVVFQTMLARLVDSPSLHCRLGSGCPPPE